MSHFLLSLSKKWQYGEGILLGSKTQALPACISSTGLHKVHLVPGNELNLSMHVPALAFLLRAVDLRVCLC